MARPGFRNHTKFLRVVRSLKMPVPHVLGHIECLWSVGYENGNPIIGDVEDIEIAAGWEGEPGAFLAAMLGCGGEGRAGLIEPVPNQPSRFQIHDFDHHVPEYVRGRKIKEAERQRQKNCGKCGTFFNSADPRAMYCSDACKQAAYRSRTVAEPDPIVTEVGNDISNVTDRDGSLPIVTALPAQPMPAHPIRIRRAASAASAPPAIASGPATAPAVSPVRLKPEDCCFPTFPCVRGVGNGPTEWTLTNGTVGRFKAAFPGVDVPLACRQAHVWIIGNPLSRKTAGGMENFLGRWMAREQNKRANGPPARASPGNETPAEFAARIAPTIKD